MILGNEFGELGLESYQITLKLYSFSLTHEMTELLYRMNNIKNNQRKEIDITITTKPNSIHLSKRKPTVKS